MKQSLHHSHTGYIISPVQSLSGAEPIFTNRALYVHIFTELTSIGMRAVPQVTTRDGKPADTTLTNSNQHPCTSFSPNKVDQ
jgi:hypothetical protein